MSCDESETDGAAGGRTRRTILRTSRLAVTTWLASDVVELQRLHSDAAVMKYMTTGMQDRAQTLDRIRTWMTEHESRGWSKWRVMDTDGRFVGRAGFSRVHGTEHREVGFLIAPEHWGAGYATELLGALVRWHFAHPAPALQPDLLAYVFSGNRPSRRVLEKNGFSLVSTDGLQTGELVYGIVAPESRGRTTG